MAQIDGRKAALIAELDMCRGEMRSALDSCGKSLNLTQRLRESFRTHALGWCTAAAAGGLALTLLLMRKGRTTSPETEEATAPSRQNARSSLGETLASKSFGVLLELASDMARPALLTWLGSVLSRPQPGDRSVPHPAPAGPRSPKSHSETDIA